MSRGSHVLPNSNMSGITCDRPYSLTKSRFMAGRQCLKRMYLDVHHRDLRTPMTEAQQALFDFGHRFGECTHQRFPEGVLVPFHPHELNAALGTTQALVADRTVPAIFEAAFLFDDILIRTDILERQADASWHLIECKSTTSVKEAHYWDIALQAYVLRGCNMNVRRYSVMHINRGYRRGSALNVERFLGCTDVSPDTQRVSKQIPPQVKTMKHLLMAPQPPHAEPGLHCWQPYPCEFWAHCTKKKTAQWVGYLPDGARQIPKLIARGVQTFKEIPEGFYLSTIQRHAVQQKEWRSPHLETVMKRLCYPIHYLHLEAAWYGIPLYPGLRPYERVPFQWTTLRESERGTLNRKDWVELSHEKAPVLAFLESLVDRVGTKGAMVIYSDAVLGTLQSLRQRSSVGATQKRAIDDLLRRCIDIREIIRSMYYHPMIHYGVYDAIPRRDTSIAQIVQILPDPQRYQLLSTLDSGWASRSYRSIAAGGSADDVVRSFEKQVLARSHQAVQALYAMRQLMTAASVPSTSHFGITQHSLAG